MRGKLTDDGAMAHGVTSLVGAVIGGRVLGEGVGVRPPSRRSGNSGYLIYSKGGAKRDVIPLFFFFPHLCIAVSGVFAATITVKNVLLEVVES